MNVVHLMGNVGADPDLRYSKDGGTAILRLRMATSETWKDRDGQKQERTDWHTVVMFGKRAEGLHRYIAKGTKLLVTGRLQTRSFEDREGVKKWITEVVASDVEFAGGRRDREEPAPIPMPGEDAGGGQDDVDLDQIPF